MSKLWRILGYVFVVSYLVWLVGVSHADTTTQIQPVQYITIQNDPGGLVADYMRWFERIQNSHIPVRVDGICVSACTFVLALGDQMCVTDHAVFGFHAAADLSNGKIDKPTTELLIQRYYPKAVREWFRQNITYNTKANEPKYLTAEDLIDMGVVKSCS